MKPDRAMIETRTGGVIKFRKPALPRAFEKKGWRCGFCAEHRTHEQILTSRFSGNAWRNGKWRFKPHDIAWTWICSDCKTQILNGHAEESK